MADRLKVEGFTSLVRHTHSNGIVNTNVSEFETYMKRIKQRERHGDQIRNAVKEINTLKAEMYEIKDILKSLCKDKK